MKTKKKTRNGYVVVELKPFDWGANGKDWLHGLLDSAALPYAVWDLKGRAAYVHNCDKSDLSGFDLIMADEETP